MRTNSSDTHTCPRPARSLVGRAVRLLLATLVATAGLVGPPLDAQVRNRLVLVQYQLVSQTPVAEGVDYVFRARLYNLGPAIPGVVATLTGTSDAATLVDDSLVFGPIGRNQSAWSTDTATVRRFGRWRNLIGDYRWSFVIGAPNRPPTADAGPDQTVTPNSVAPLDGSASTDPDGDALTFEWQLAQAPAGSQAVLSDATAVRPTLPIDLAGTYVVSLVVRDGQNASAADTVTLSTANTAPVADAGPDQAVLVGQTVTLDGSASSDVDGDPVTYAWAWLSVPTGSTAALQEAASVAPQFTADRPGTYVVQLVVDDGRAASAADTVSVSTVNTPPVANAGADQAIVAGQRVTLDGGTSYDPDGDAIAFRWSISSAPAGSVLAIPNPTDPIIEFVADRPGDYVLQLVVNDGQEDSAADTVVVSTSNTTPVANAGPDQAGTPGRTVILDGSASGDADGHLLSYAWSIVSAPSGSLAALEDEASVSPTLMPDRPGSYVVQLIVHDGYVASAPDTVRIDVAEPLPFVRIEAVDAEAAELGRDPGVFRITRTGSTALPLQVTLRATGATQGTDYDSLEAEPVTTPGTVTFVVTIPSGQEAVELTITPRPDNVVEQPDEVAVLAIDPGAGYLVDLAREAGVTIADDPPIVTILAGDPNAAERGPDGVDTGRFDITRSGGDATVPLTVVFDVTGTATPGVDYDGLSGSQTAIEIPAGLSTATVFVVPIADSLAEPAETVIATIVVSQNYLAGTPNTALITIR